MDNPTPHTTFTVEVNGADEQTAEWTPLGELRPGDLVVEGPGTGSKWMSENRVCGVRDVEALNVDNDLEVTLSNGGAVTGNAERACLARLVAAEFPC